MLDLCPYCGATLKPDTEHAPTCSYAKYKTMQTGRYILGGADGHEVIACPDLLFWALWLDGARAVKYDAIDGHFEVSTVFLGCELTFARSTSAPPLHIFETAVFSLEMGGYRGEMRHLQRCGTWIEAIEQHHELLRKYKQSVTG